MELDEFRREAHRLVDWMADYLAEVERYPVRAQVRARRDRGTAAGSGRPPRPSRWRRSSPISSGSSCPA